MCCCGAEQGIGTSLGLLANILVSMNDEDFEALKNNPDVDLVSGQRAYRSGTSVSINACEQ